MAPFVVPVRRAIVSCPQPRRALSTQGAAATWMLNLNTNGEVRVYTVMGKTNLTDAAWACPTNAAHRFFKVNVEMP